MKRSLSRFAYVIAFLMVAGYAFVTLRGPNGLKALFQKQAQIEDMEKRNADLAKDVERRRERIKRLDENSTTQELEIRERLKLVKPGEKIYVLPEKK